MKTKNRFERGAILKFHARWMKVELSPSFFICIALAATLGMTEQFFISFVCLSAHELTHVIFARFFGACPNKLTLSALGLNANIRGFDYIPLFKKIIVILSGPLLNLVIAVSAWHLIGADSDIFLINITLFCINMSPICPLDGGRLVLSMLENRVGVICASRLCEKIGIFFSILIIIAGCVQLVLFPYNPILTSIGAYLYNITKMDGVDRIFGFYMKVVLDNEKHKYSRIIRVKTIYVPPYLALKEVFNKITWNSLLVVHTTVNEKTVSVSETEIIDAALNNGLNASLESCIRICYGQST